MGGKPDEAAQVCASILVKLVMDMVLKAGTAVALPLALVLLHRWPLHAAKSLQLQPKSIHMPLALVKLPQNVTL